MATKRKSAKAKKPRVKVRDLNAKKDAKGGDLPLAASQIEDRW